MSRNVFIRKLENWEIRSNEFLYLIMRLSGRCTKFGFVFVEGMKVMLVVETKRLSAENFL